MRGIVSAIGKAIALLQWSGAGTAMFSSSFPPGLSPRSRTEMLAPMKRPIIDPDTGKTDVSSGDYTKLLRTPDLRFIDLRWERRVEDGPFLLDFPDPRRACFYFVRRGGAFFRTGTGELRYIGAGTAVGVEGRAHQWMDRSRVDRRDAPRLVPAALRDQPAHVELLASSVDRRAAVLQGLQHGAIVIPPRADPHAAMIRGCVDLIELNRLSSAPDQGIARRLAEVIMLEIVSFARSRLWPNAASGDGAMRDEFILRAMTAFFREPGAAWTVGTLAAAAGLSRTAFSERFGKAFGESPARAINRLRLMQAAEMLRSSRASLGDIATEVGFGSAAALSRAFNRQFGQTPGKWRAAPLQNLAGPEATME